MDNQMSFEDMMAALEKYVSVLEKGGLSLDESSELYEKGMKIASEAGKKLTNSELKIRNIRENYKQTVSNESMPEES